MGLVDIAREVELLREYRNELVAAEEQLRDHQAETEALRQIVAGIESRVTRLGGTVPSHSPDKLTAAEPRGIRPLKPPPRRKRRGLKNILRSIMADGEPRNLAQIAEAVTAHEVFKDEPPAPASLQNRLWELETKDGYLTRDNTGNYALAPTSDAARNGAGGAEANEAEPRQALQLERGEGLGSTPPGGFS